MTSSEQWVKREMRRKQQQKSKTVFTIQQRREESRVSHSLEDSSCEIKIFQTFDRKYIETVRPHANNLVLNLIFKKR